MVVACRDASKGRDAEGRIRAAHPKCDARFEALDRRGRIDSTNLNAERSGSIACIGIPHAEIGKQERLDALTARICF